MAYQRKTRDRLQRSLFACVTGILAKERRTSTRITVRGRLTSSNRKGLEREQDAWDTAAIAPIRSLSLICRK